MYNFQSITHHFSYHSTGGVQWGRDNVKTFFVNMYTYYAKGMADYVGIWDYDEFFQPRGENKNILDVIRAMESPLGPIRNTAPSELKSGQRARRGMADSDGHPYCYLILESEVTKVDEECKRPDAVRMCQVFVRMCQVLVQQLVFADTVMKPTASACAIIKYILMNAYITTQ